MLKLLQTYYIFQKKRLDLRFWQLSTLKMQMKKS